MASEQERKMVILKSNDGEIFEVEKEVAALSEMINQMIEEDDINGEFPLPLVSGKVLAKIIEYCTKHVQIDSPKHDNGKGKVDENADAISTPSKKNDLKDWDKNYISLDMSQLFEIVQAANYLNIKELLDLTCQKIADEIQDKSVEEVREIFQIENDFTPEEEEAIRKEHPWAFE